MRSHILDLGAFFIALLLAFIVLPGSFMALAPQEFAGVAPGWLWRSALVLVSVCLALGIAAYALLTACRLQLLSRMICWLSLFWVATAGFGIPIVESVEMVAPDSTPTATGGLIAATMIALVMTALALTRFRKYAVIYLGVQLAVALVPAAASIQRALMPRGESDVARFMSLSPERNVLVVSMDDISGALAHEVLENDPVLRARFADFLFFEGVIGNAPATFMSITHELFGARDYKALGNDEAAVGAALDRSELVLNDLAVDAMTYGSYNAYNAWPERSVEHVAVLPPMPAIMDLYQYVAARLGTRHAAAVLSTMETHSFDLATLTGMFFDVECTDCDPLLAEIENHYGPSWDTQLLVSRVDFDMFLEHVSVGGSDFTLRYMHFLFTHFPVDFDESCTFRGNDAEWYFGNQNEAGALAETACSLSLFAELLDRLKEAGVYDNTLIVLKSDHGKPRQYFNGPPGTLRFNGNELWGLDRYRPLLMIKEQGARGDAITFSDRPSTLSDLAATLCPRLPGSANCNAFPGVDILDPASGLGPPIQVYVPRDAEATHRFADHVRLILERGQSLADRADSP